jgi:hypothetical protein
MATKQEMIKVNTEIDSQHDYSFKKIQEIIDYEEISKVMKIDLIQQELNRFNTYYKGIIDRVIHNM